MYTTPTQFVEMQKSHVDALNTLGHALFSAAEKLITLNLAAVKAVMQDTSESTRTLLGARDAQELMALSSALGQPNIEKAVGYSRNFYAIVSDAGAEIAKVFEAQINDGNRKATEMLELVSKNAPAGSEPLVSMFKSAVAASNTAFDTAQKTAKQATDWAESNFAVAAAATVNAANAADDATKAKVKKAA
jgi:phasin family protein